MTARAIRMAERAEFPRAPPGAFGRTVPVAEVTVAAALVLDMAAYLRAKGVDAAAVCQRAGIDLAGLDVGNGRVNARRMTELWRECERATADPEVGLHMAVAFNPGALDIVGYVMLSSRTADEALRRGARLMRLLNDGLDLHVERGRSTTTVRLVVLPRAHELMRTESRHVVDTVIAGLVHQLRLLTHAPVVPVAATFRYTKPATGDAELTRLIGVTPRFGAEHDSVTLANADLDVPLRSANPALLSSFEAVADAALGSLASKETLGGRVDAEIMVRLKGGLPTIADIAKALAMSSRNLQRGLAAEGTTFQLQLDAARRELAVRHLAAPGTTVAQVAWLVGFSEPSAFHRAFRRWTGQSPRAAIA